jgi:hypothetical protein
MRQTVRLKYVATVDFRKSEATNYKLLPAMIRRRLKPNEAVCLKSGSGNQIVFVFKPSSVTRADGAELEVVHSTRLRLPKHRSWNPLMIADYAASVGLQLVGLKRLRDHLEKP